MVCPTVMPASGPTLQRPTAPTARRPWVPTQSADLAPDSGPRPYLEHAGLGDSGVEGGLAAGGRAVHDRAVGDPERAAVPGADHTQVLAFGHEPALVQRAAEVGAVVGQGGDRGALAEHQQVEVAERLADRAAVGQIPDPAQVVPAERRSERASCRER